MQFLLYKSVTEFVFPAVRQNVVFVSAAMRDYVILMRIMRDGVYVRSVGEPYTSVHEVRFDCAVL
jgi:hypothetical protein